MEWIVATPFTKSTKGWIMRFIPVQQHDFCFIAPQYAHDRSRANSSAKDWLEYFQHAWTSWQAARQLGPDNGFVTAFPQLPLFLGLLKRLTGSKRPILAWCFNLGQTYTGWKGRLARFGLRDVDLFVVHSRHEIDTYSQWLNIPPERFVFVPLSIELQQPNQKEDLDAPFILSMGSAHRDYQRLFEAVAELGYPTKIVAGPHAVAGLKIPSNVEILSNLTIEQCHALCQKARINVVPVDNSETASGQVTVLEAMMYGKAVIATDCIGTRDYIEHGRNGWLVPAHQTEALTQSLQEFWNDAELRNRIGQQALSYIHESACFPAVAKVMSGMLDKLASNR